MPKQLSIVNPVAIKFVQLENDYPKAVRIKFAEKSIWNLPKSLIKIYYHNNVVIMPAKFAQQRGLEQFQV